MTVAYDAHSNNQATFSNWTHTPSGTPKGVVVFVSAESAATGVTYGGEAMTELPSSPVSGSSGELNGQDVTGWVLKSGVPTGAQTVAVSGPGQGTFLGHAYTVTADDDIEVADDASIISTSVSNASVTLSLGGETCFCCEAWYSGENSTASVSPLSNWTSRQEIDAGSVVLGSYSYDTIGSSDVTAGLTQSNDDLLLLAVAVYEVSSETNIAVGVDALSLTDLDPVIGYDLQVGVDSLTITENAVTVSQDYDVSVGVDNLSLTDIDPVIGYDLQVGIDTLSLTDINPAIGYDVQVGVDALTLTDFAVTVTTEGGVNIEVGVDNLTLTDLAPTIGYDLQVSSDALTLTDFQATVTTEAGETAYPGPAGRKRRKYVVIDNHEFPVDSVQEAQQLLDQAVSLAERKARTDVKRAVVSPEAKITATYTLPVLNTPAPEFKQAVIKASKRIQEIYEEVAREESNRVEIERKRLIDEEEAVISLLLH